MNSLRRSIGLGLFQRNGADAESPYEVDPDSGRVDYNGFPPLCRGYCDAGVWPAWDGVGSGNSERNYTQRIPRGRRLDQGLSLLRTERDRSAGTLEAERENLKPVLTVRNLSPESSVLSYSASLKKSPSGGISPCPGPVTDSTQDGSLLTVQPVMFGRRSMDAHRGQFSGFPSTCPNPNIHSTSCHSCDIQPMPGMPSDNVPLHTSTSLNTAKDITCSASSAGNADVAAPHLQPGDYSDIFGTFGQRDDYTSSHPVSHLTGHHTGRPKIENILTPTASRYAFSTQREPSNNRLHIPLHPREVFQINTQPSRNELSGSSQTHTAVILPEASTTQPRSDDQKQANESGSVDEPGHEEPGVGEPSKSRETNRVSWVLDAVGAAGIAVPTVIADSHPSQRIREDTVSSGPYRFKLGSLKVGKGFKFNARAKSPYPRALNPTPLSDEPSTIPVEPATELKWSRFNLHSRRADSSLGKARSNSSLYQSRTSVTAPGHPSKLAEGVRDPTHIKGEPLSGRPGTIAAPTLSLAHEFRRKNDLLAMEIGYRIPERMTSPTRSEKMDRYDENYDGRNLLSRAKRRLGKALGSGEIDAR